MAPSTTSRRLSPRPPRLKPWRSPPTAATPTTTPTASREAAKRAKRKNKGPYLYSGDNARRVLTCCTVTPADLDRPLAAAKCAHIARALAALRRRLELHATTDPHDRAHTQTLLSYLVPAATPAGRPTPRLHAHPRLYHDHHLVGPAEARISIDSAFDAWHQARSELAAAGISLGGRAWRTEDAARQVLLTRDLCERKTKCVLTPAEQDLEDQASALLARSR